MERVVEESEAGISDAADVEVGADREYLEAGSSARLCLVIAPN